MKERREGVELIVEDRRMDRLKEAKMGSIIGSIAFSRSAKSLRSCCRVEETLGIRLFLERGSVIARVVRKIEMRST